MGRYREASLEHLQRVAIGQRHSRVDAEFLARPAGQVDSFEQFWDGLPPVLAARDLRGLARAVVSARRGGRPVVWMFGAHVIKVGLTPILIRLLREDLATLVAVNGAFAIHDTELALWGVTSEDVAEELAAGRFGMACESTQLLNDCAREASERAEGLGEAIGRRVAGMRASWHAESVLGTCYEIAIPATVHVAIGTDITHQHPEFSGAATGDASARDFRILAAHLQDLAGAVVINVGSAVILPEVFLKAVSVAINLGASNEGLVTATFDFERQYRPARNVVERPVGRGGSGCYIVGHHEILLPLFLQGVLLERQRSA